MGNPIRSSAFFTQAVQGTRRAFGLLCSQSAAKLPLFFCERLIPTTMDSDVKAYEITRDQQSVSTHIIL